MAKKSTPTISAVIERTLFFSVQQKSLAVAIDSVMPAVGKSVTMPDLTHILLTATDDNRLTLTATNLEMSLVYQLPAKVETPGALSLPAKTLKELVSSFTGDIITMQLKDKTTMTIECARLKSSLKGLKADSFPMIAPMSNPLVTLPVDTLRTALRYSIFCIAEDDARPVLASLRFALGPDNLTLVSSDGFRLSEHVTPMEYAGPPLAALIPRVSAHALESMVSKQSEEVKIGAELMQTDEARFLHFQVGPVTLTTSLVEGTYMDYTKIIPKKFERAVSVSRADLMQAIKTALVFGREMANTVRLAFCESSETVKIEAVAAETGDGTTEIACTPVSDLTIAFNGQYLNDALSATRAEFIRMLFNSSTSPSMIKGDEHDHWQCVIMPLDLRK